MFDPRDDARDVTPRGRQRARVRPTRHGWHEPRNVLMRASTSKRGDERELVVDRDRVYELDGEDSLALAASSVRVVPNTISISART